MTSALKEADKFFSVSSRSMFLRLLSVLVQFGSTSQFSTGEDWPTDTVDTLLNEEELETLTDKTLDCNLLIFATDFLTKSVGFSVLFSSSAQELFSNFVSSLETEAILSVMNFDKTFDFLFYHFFVYLFLVTVRVRGESAS